MFEGRGNSEGFWMGVKQTDVWGPVDLLGAGGWGATGEFLGAGGFLQAGVSFGNSLIYSCFRPAPTLGYITGLPPTTNLTGLPAITDIQRLRIE